jgi:hypothetical protein
MQNHQPDYDWFGCKMQHTVMVEYDLSYGDRPWAGSQMGRKKAFGNGLERIDDDYVYRQEDFVFADIVKKAGFKEGKVSDTFHYHQTIRKASPWERKIKSVQLEVDMSREEQVRTHMMQVRGLIKYLDPDPILLKSLVGNMTKLVELKEMSWPELIQWAADTNPNWVPWLSKEAKNDRRWNLIRAAKSLFRRYIK